MDLLEHKMLETALLCRIELPVRPLAGLYQLIAMDIIDYYAIRPDLGDLIFLQQIIISRISKDRRYVRGDKVLVLAEPYDQRRLLPYAVDPVRKIPKP